MKYAHYICHAPDYIYLYVQLLGVRNQSEHAPHARTICIIYMPCSLRHYFTTRIELHKLIIINAEVVCIILYVHIDKSAPLQALKNTMLYHRTHTQYLYKQQCQKQSTRDAYRTHRRCPLSHETNEMSACKTEYKIMDLIVICPSEQVFCPDSTIMITRRRGLCQFPYSYI